MYCLYIINQRIEMTEKSFIQILVSRELDNFSKLRESHSMDMKNKFKHIIQKYFLLVRGYRKKYIYIKSWSKTLPLPTVQF